MQDFLAQTFYGNTIGRWAVALAIAVAALVVGKTVYWFTRGILKRWTKRTDTQLDDMLIDMLDEPLVVIVTALGFGAAARSLSLPEGAVEFVGGAIQAAIVLAVAWVLVRLFDAVVRHVLEPLADSTDNDLDDQLLPIIRRGGRGAIWILGVIMALNNAGYDVAALIAGLGIGGIALAMASQDTVKNVFGGFTIFTDRPFKTGDRIVVSGFDGVVDEIGVRSTRLRTLAGRVVTIPNSSISNSPVENISSEPSRKIVQTLGLTYDTSAEGMGRAMETLRQIAGEHVESLDGEPTVCFKGFGDFSMNVLFIYRIRAGVDIWATQTSINLAILERFTAEGLEMAFPTQTIHARIDPAQP